MEARARYGVRFAFYARYNASMTPQEIKRAYDAAVAEVLEEHRERITQIIGKERGSDDAARRDAIRLKLFKQTP